MAYKDVILADNPLAYYRLDDTSGPTAHDSSGHNYNGSYIDAAEITFSKPGALVGDTDTAIQITTVNPYTQQCGVQTPLSNIGSTQMSVEAWIQVVTLPPDAFHNASIASNGASNDGSAFSFGVDHTNGLFVQYQTVGATGFDGIYGASAVPLPSGTWVYVVFTYDGNLAKLYVDGILKATVGSLFGSAPVYFSGADFCIGTRPTNGRNYWDDFLGVLDEVAFYGFALTGTQVYNHWLAGQGSSPAIPTWSVAGNDRHYYAIEIWDKTGSTLLDLPQADIDSLSFEDVINGGSGQGTLTFRRGFNNIGQIQPYKNRVLVWIWHGGIARPTNPYWAGFMGDLDQEATVTEGKITVHLLGDSVQMGRGIVSENINPLIAGNPNLDAADYIRHLLSTYAPPGFATYSVPSAMFPLLPMQFSRQKLGSVIDTVTKTGRDDVGQLWTWRVSSDYQCKRTFLIQPDQNPNHINGITFTHIFREGMCAKYTINTKYRDLVNVVLVEGARDPNTGQTVSAVYEDSASVAEYDPWEDAISVPSLVNSDACYAYGEAYLDMHANPSAQGEIELWKPDPTIRAGTWIQAWELAGVVKQMRVGSVKVEIKPTRVIQTLSPTAPTPYLDEAVYKMGLNVQGSISSMQRGLATNTQQNYVRLGGSITIGP